MSWSTKFALIYLYINSVSIFFYYYLFYIFDLEFCLDI